MRRALFILSTAVAAAGLATGCGENAEPQAEAATSASSAAPSSSAAADSYGGDFIDAFRSTYPETGRYEGDRGEAADWQAFTRVVEKLTPPEDRELDHERTVSAFQAYVAADQDAEQVCLKSPGPGGPCFTATSEASDQWAAALQRAYEIPGITRAALLD